MIKINNYLHFSGRCKEAMEFYRSVFGGELTMQTVGESPMAAHMPPESHGNIMHAMLKGDQITLMGSDMMDAGNATGSKVSLTIIADTALELKPVFAKLAEGGQVHQELKVEFFGTYGDLVDKFGIPWMFQSDQKGGETK